MRGSRQLRELGKLAVVVAFMGMVTATAALMLVPRPAPEPTWTWPKEDPQYAWERDYRLWLADSLYPNDTARQQAFVARLDSISPIKPRW